MKEENEVYSDMELFLDKMARKSLKLIKTTKKDVFEFSLYLLVYVGIVSAFFYFDNILLNIVFGLFSFLLTVLIVFIAYNVIKLMLKLNEKNLVFLLVSTGFSDYVAHIGNVTYLGYGIKLKNFIFSKEEIMEFTKLVIEVFGEEKSKEYLAKTLVGGEYSFYDAVRLHANYSYEFKNYNKKIQQERADLFAKGLVEKAGREG